MSDNLDVNDEKMLDVECGEAMNEKTHNDVLAHLQTRFDSLPQATVLVPPSAEPEGTIIHCPVCDGSHTGHHLCEERFEREVEGVNNKDDETHYWGADWLTALINTRPQTDMTRHPNGKVSFSDDELETIPPSEVPEPDLDVEFGDAKLMSRANYTDADVIEEFIRNYPYPEFTYICRKLKMKPAECLERVLAFNEEGNGWYSATQESESLKADAARLEGWEPGTPPTTPMNRAEVLTLLNSIFKVELSLRSTWTIYDMAYRTGLSTEEMTKLLVDYVVSHVLGQFKYMGRQKWLLSPEEIGQAAVNCEWVQGFPTYEQMREKRPTVPYVDYCSRCGQFYTSNETACEGCGALRMYEDPRP
jgi:hypothetical protein